MLHEGADGSSGNGSRAAATAKEGTTTASPTLSDVELYSEDVAGELPPGAEPSEGRLALEQLVVWTSIYLAFFRSLLDRIRTLPLAFRQDGSPLAAELAKADEDFDNMHEAIERFLTTMLLSTLIPAWLRDAARRVQGTLMLTPAQRRGTYADQASIADDLRERAARCMNDLLLFRVPGDEGATLAMWVEGLANHARQISILLRKRAELLAAEGTSRGDAFLLRSEGLGLIARARAALTDELASRPDLPRDVVTRGFAYWDSLVTARSGAQPKKKPTAKTPQDTPAE